MWRNVEEPNKNLRNMPPTFRYEAYLYKLTLLIPGLSLYMFVCDVSLRFVVVVA